MPFSFSNTAATAALCLLFSRAAFALPAETNTITAQPTILPSGSPDLIDVLRKNNPYMVARAPQAGDSTPTNQPINPINGQPQQQQGGNIVCRGRLPSWDYPGFLQRSDFDSNQNLCANRQNGGRADGNLGGYCNTNLDPPEVDFQQRDALFELYNDDSFMIHCFLNCHCVGRPRPQPVAGGLVPYRNNVYINVANYGYVLVYGDINSPTSTRTVLSTGLGRPTARRSLNYAVLGSQISTSTSSSSSSSSIPAEAIETDRSSPGAAGFGILVNPPNPDPEEGQCGAECTSNGACKYDDSEASSQASIQSCGVCEVGSPSSYVDPVFPPGRCAQAIPVSLLMTAVTGLLGRDVAAGNASAANLSSILPPLPQYNLPQPRACACNATFVHLLCCGYHNGTVPGTKDKSLGKVEIPSA